MEPVYNRLEVIGRTYYGRGTSERVIRSMSVGKDGNLMGSLNARGEIL